MSDIIVVYGQDTYTSFLHAAHKHARFNSPKQCAVQRSTRVDAQFRKVGAGLLFWTDLEYPTKLLFLRWNVQFVSSNEEKVVKHGTCFLKRYCFYSNLCSYSYGLSRFLLKVAIVGEGQSTT